MSDQECPLNLGLFPLSEMTSSTSGIQVEVHDFPCRKGVPSYVLVVLVLSNLGLPCRFLILTVSQICHLSLPFPFKMVTAYLSCVPDPLIADI
jgi:hypothetical protein